MPDLIPDGKIVNEDKSINIQKCAIDYAWNIPRFAEKVGFDESLMREKLAAYTHNPDVLDKSKNAYLPPLGGCTVYFFGDLTKLNDPTTEVAVRVHDSCCGSDVFGTDICTCRPYLVFAIQACVDTAQRGGVGIVVYFQKEGRGLGEVTKYRVYNARKNQEGGDRSEKYFYQTQSIAGIEDARFQQIMPDVLCWLGIDRIDWLLSMSSEKYDAITAAGIQVMQRVSIPDSYIPKNAHIEINAKIAAGYHSNKSDDQSMGAKLSTLEMVREKCGKIFELAKNDKTRHFKLDLKKLPAVVDYTIEVTKKNYPDLKVPYHSRWRHFKQNDVDELKASWKCSEKEKVRRLIDLVTVSVLLDAGAGNEWKYIDSRGKEHARSEGLAIASFEMFKDGLFSSDSAMPHRVNARGIKKMSFKAFSKAFQIDEKHNPLLGAKSRFDMIQRVADALLASKHFFGEELARPGNMVDYVLEHAKDNKVSLKVLWTVIIDGLRSIWPVSRSGVSCTTGAPSSGFDGTKAGDIWVYSQLKEIGKAASEMVPFHKLSQWLTYSLLEPLESLELDIEDLDLMTGLPEYRNGGLFVDMDVLIPRDPTILQPSRDFSPGSELIVEWRALTLCLLDLLGKDVAKKLGKTTTDYPLAKVLQGGTWAAGRLIAAKKRPKTKAPPIRIRSDGTVF
jgi:GTP cyclohydrolase II